MEKFVELVGRVDGQRKEHETGCAKAGRLLPAPSRLRLGAKQVCHTAERLESRMDVRERNAHIRAAGDFRILASEQVRQACPDPSQGLAQGVLRAKLCSRSDQRIPLNQLVLVHENVRKSSADKTARAEL